MLTFTYPLVTNGDMSQTTITSTSQQMTNMLYFSIQCRWTDGTGTLKVQASNDNSNWTDLSSSSITTQGSQPAGSASNLLFNNNATGCPWEWLRVIYTKGSGVGVLNVNINAKGA